MGTPLQGMLGPYEIIGWVEPPKVAIARHSLTHENVCLKIEGVFSDLVSDACTLRYLAGGIGFPTVHWFGMLDGYDVLAIDLCGPSLEHVFNGLGYKFDLRYLYILADQLLTRLEFAHSRFTVHGNLNPHSVYIGCFPWQRQQIVLSCPVSCPKPRYCFRDDLLALGDLLHYLSSDATSWVEFQRDQYDGRLKKRSDIFDDYMDAVSSAYIPDYAALRRIFHNAHQQLELYSIPIFELSNTLELGSETIAVPSPAVRVQVRSDPRESQVKGLGEAFSQRLHIVIIFIKD